MGGIHSPRCGLQHPHCGHRCCTLPPTGSWTAIRRWARGLRTTLQTIGKAVPDRGCLRRDTAGGVFLYIFALSVASYPVLRNRTALVGGGEEVELPSSKGV